MKFFKKNHDKGQEVPALPAGDGGVEAVEDCLEAIKPCVCTLDFPSFLIHLPVIEPFLRAIPSVPGIGTDIGNDAVSVEGVSEFLSVKTGVKVTEKPVHGNIGVGELFHEFPDPFPDLIEVGVVARLGFGHGQGYALIVRQKEGIGGTTFLSALILNLFTSTAGRSVGAGDMGDGKIKLLFIFLQYVGIHGLPLLFYTPFAVMVKDSVPAWRFAAEKMSRWKQTPLAAALKLVENGIDNLHKIEFADRFWRQNLFSQSKDRA